MHTISHLIHAYGLLVVAGVIGLECMGVPVPGETALVIASAIAGKAQPELNIVEVIVTAAAASMVGRIIGYGIGAKFGYWLLLRYGIYLRITPARIKLGQYLFLRHGGKIIVIAQFVPVMRAIAGLLAGANRMPWRRYLFASAVGAIVWSVFFGVSAFYLGRQVERVAGSLTTRILIGLAIVVILVLLAVFASRHEAHLSAKAERALPGPLQLP